jgi:hypothetical protein
MCRVLVVILALLAGGGALADTIKLKDGTVLEGTVVSQDEQTVHLRIDVSGGTIFQTRQIPVADIAEIRILTEEERAQQAMEQEFAALQKLKVHPQQSYRLEDYDRVLQRFQAFQSQYTNSPHLAEISALIAPWQAERDQVAAGMVKYNGEWVSRAELSQQAASIQARQLIEQARAQFVSGQYLPALQLLNKASGLSVDPDIKGEVQSLISQVYSTWFPYLDNRSTQLQGELQKARADLKAAENELKQAQTAVKILPGFNQSDGSSGGLSGGTQQMGQGAERAQAAARIAKANEKLAKAKHQVTRLEQEETFVTTYLGFARQNAQKLGISDTVASVEQAKNPGQTAQSKSHEDEILERSRRRLAPETGDTPGVLIDLWRWIQNNWPLAIGLLALLLWLLYKYLIDR